MSIGPYKSDGHTQTLVVDGADIGWWFVAWKAFAAVGRLVRNGVAGRRLLVALVEIVRGALVDDLALLLAVAGVAFLADTGVGPLGVGADRVHVAGLCRALVDICASKTSFALPTHLCPLSADS